MVPTRVLQEVSLHVDPGEIVTIVGAERVREDDALARHRRGRGAYPRAKIARAPGLVIGYLPQRLQIDPTLPMTVERFFAFRAVRAGQRSRLRSPGPV